MLERSKVLHAEYTYKGAEIAVFINKTVLTPADYKRMLDIKRDKGIIKRIFRKFKIDSITKLDSLLDSYKPLKNIPIYTVRVTMQGFTEESNAHDSSRIRRCIQGDRQYIINELRNKKPRYIQVQPVSISARTIAINSNASQELRDMCFSIEDNFNMFGNRQVGHVHSEPNQILRIQQHRRTKKMFERVKPMTAERHVGIEIECGIKIEKEELADKLMHLAGYVMIKSDSSVGVPDRNNIEINVCAPMSIYKDILRQLTDVLNSKEVGAKVNKTCGLHVHLDAREYGYNFSQLNNNYSRLVAVQSILYSMQPKSRQNNSYCKRSKTRNIRRGSARYQGINAQSLWKYNTIEIRLHAGTTEYLKIVNWVDLVCGVMYSAVQPPKRSMTSVRSFFRTFQEVPTSLMEYVVERINRFSDSSIEESDMVAV
jgi:hypothetical protein